MLVDEDLEIFDSTQIFEYFEDVVPEPCLWPRERTARARARSMELRSDEVFFPNVVQLFPQHRMRDGEGKAAEALENIGRFYADVERLLSRSEYLAPEFSLWKARSSTRAAERRPRCARMGRRESVRKVLGRACAFLQEQGSSRRSYRAPGLPGALARFLRH